MKYHAKTLNLLNMSPVMSSSAVSDLDEVEVRISRNIPASVREWYSLTDAIRRMHLYSNDDPPLKIQEFGQPRKDTHGGAMHDLLARDLVPFRYENQAVCVWAFLLDGSDDPPVVVDVDSQFKTWTECTSKFSDHLYWWMWDYSKVLTNDLLVQAQNQPITEAVLEVLKSNYDEGLKTSGWPGTTQYRFSRGDKRVLIWAGDDQADWWLTADDKESLQHLISEIWELDCVGEAMWSNDEQSEALLERVKAER